MCHSIFIFKGTILKSYTFVPFFFFSSTLLSITYIQKCTHFKCKFQWILTNVYTCVPTTPIRYTAVHHPKKFPYDPCIIYPSHLTPDNHWSIAVTIDEFCTVQNFMKVNHTVWFCLFYFVQNSVGGSLMFCK